MTHTHTVDVISICPVNKRGVTSRAFEVPFNSTQLWSQTTLAMDDVIRSCKKLTAVDIIIIVGSLNLTKLETC
jgi:hypothetical protein